MDINSRYYLITDKKILENLKFIFNKRFCFSKTIDIKSKNSLYEMTLTVKKYRSIVLSIKTPATKKHHINIDPITFEIDINNITNLVCALLLHSKRFDPPIKISYSPIEYRSRLTKSPKKNLKLLEECIEIKSFITEL